MTFLKVWSDSEQTRIGSESIGADSGEPPGGNRLDTFIVFSQLFMRRI